MCIVSQSVSWEKKKKKKKVNNNNKHQQGPVPPSSNPLSPPSTDRAAICAGLPLPKGHRGMAECYFCVAAIYVVVCGIRVCE